MIRYQSLPPSLLISPSLQNHFADDKSGTGGNIFLIARNSRISILMTQNRTTLPIEKEASKRVGDESLTSEQVFYAEDPC